MEQKHLEEFIRDKLSRPLRMPFEILLDSLYELFVAGVLPVSPLQQFCTLFAGHFAQITRLVVWRSGNGGSARSNLLNGFDDIRPIECNIEGEDTIVAERRIQERGDNWKTGIVDGIDHVFCVKRNKLVSESKKVSQPG